MVAASGLGRGGAERRPASKQGRWRRRGRGAAGKEVERDDGICDGVGMDWRKEVREEERRKRRCGLLPRRLR